MRRLLVVVLGIGLIALAVPAVAGTFTQAQAVGCVNDDDDDVLGDRPAEIRRFCAAITSGGFVQFRIDVLAVRSVNSSPMWSETFQPLVISMETTGDEEADYRLVAQTTGFGLDVHVIDLSDFSRSCEDVTLFDGDNAYLVETTTECIGNAGRLSALAELTYDPEDNEEFGSDSTAAVEAGDTLPPALPTPSEEPTQDTGDPRAFRLEGPSRFETAIAVSQYSFRTEAVTSICHAQMSSPTPSPPRP